MTDTDESKDRGESGPQPIILPGRTGLPTRLRNWFLTGIIVTAPIGITIYLAWIFIAWIDDRITPLIPARYNPETYLPFSIPGLGLVVIVVFLTFVGFVTANLFGRTVIAAGERLVNRMPVIRTIYGALKQVLETVLQNSSQSFKQVVLIEYPRPGMWALAFVTRETDGEIRQVVGEPMFNVFLPTTPNPTSGFLLFLPKRDCILLDMTIEEAAKLIISGGVVAPSDVPRPLAETENRAIAAGGQGR